jgi:hypothetical protein
MGDATAAGAKVCTEAPKTVLKHFYRGRKNMRLFNHLLLSDYPPLASIKQSPFFVLSCLQFDLVTGRLSPGYLLIIV